MIDIIIICPIEIEFKIIRKIIGNSKPVSHKDLSFDFGQIKGKNFNWNIAIIEPELNLKSFSLKVSKVINLLNPKYVFLAGIAGGIKDSKIEDIVIGTKAYMYEGGKETEEGFVARPRMIENKSIELLTLAKRIARESKSENTKFHFGPIASGNKVLADMESQSINVIKKHYNDTQAIEMEAYDFAQAAAQSDKQYINIRGISDLIGGKAKSDAEGFQELVMKKVASFVEQLIHDLPVPPQTEHYSFVTNSSDREFNLMSLRKLSKTSLVFNDDYIEVSESDKTYKLRSLKLVEHVKMGGDIKPNWVKVVFILNGKLQERFYSDRSSLGSNNWLGGSKKLFKAFREFEEQQIPLDVALA